MVASVAPTDCSPLPPSLLAQQSDHLDASPALSGSGLPPCPDNLTLYAALMATAANLTLGGQGNLSYEQFLALTQPGMPGARRIWIYGAPVIIAVGLVCNCLSLAVMRRPALGKLTASTYLAVLAGVDSAALLLGLLRFWLIEMYGVDIRNLSSAACKLHISATYWVFQYEAWVLVSVTLERYVAVCRPAYYSRMFTRWRACAGLLVMALVLAGVNMHFLWTYRLYAVGEVRWCYARDSAQHFATRVWPWCDLVLASLLPFALMLYMNSAISCRLLQRRRRRRMTAAAARRGAEDGSGGMTAMLLAVTFLFVLLSLPYCIYFVIVKMLVGDTETYVLEDQERVHIAHACTSLLAYSNYSINFLLYCLGGRRFRRELHTLLTEVAANCSSATNGGGHHRGEHGHVSLAEISAKNLRQDDETTREGATSIGEAIN